jgi:hypothetical protein
MRADMVAIEGQLTIKSEQLDVLLKQVGLHASAALDRIYNSVRECFLASNSFATFTVLLWPLQVSQRADAAEREGHIISEQRTVIAADTARVRARLDEVG